MAVGTKPQVRQQATYVLGKVWKRGFHCVMGPLVLKAVEDSLAQYIGPVAKILVARAASQTKDLHELCQALAAQLSTEQERKSFLQSALRPTHTPPDAPR